MQNVLLAFANLVLCLTVSFPNCIAWPLFLSPLLVFWEWSSSELIMWHILCRRFEPQIHRPLWWKTTVGCPPLRYYAWSLKTLYMTLWLQVSQSSLLVPLLVLGTAMNAWFTSSITVALCAYNRQKILRSSYWGCSVQGFSVSLWHFIALERLQVVSEKKASIWAMLDEH